MDFNAAFVVGAIIGFVIGLAVGGSIGALLLMLATRIAAKFVPGFWRAFGTVVASACVSMLISFVLGLFIGAMGHAAGVPPATIKLIGIPVGAAIGFLVAAAFIRLIIRRPDGSRLSWGRCFLTALVNTLFGLAVFAMVLGGLHLLGQVFAPGAEPPLNM